MSRAAVRGVPVTDSNANEDGASAVVAEAVGLGAELTELGYTGARLGGRRGGLRSVKFPFVVFRMSPRCLLSLLVPLTAFWAGCQTGEVVRVVPVSGGGRINVPMTGKGPAPGEAEGYKMARAELLPASASQDPREVRYTFAIVAENDPAIKRIQIEDISDEKAAPLVDDQQPAFKDRRWEAQSEVLTPEDPRLKWIYQITLSFRVYKVTLTANDGHTFSFNHVTIYPPFVKEAIRSKWGEKY